MKNIFSATYFVCLSLVISSAARAESCTLQEWKEFPLAPKIYGALCIGDFKYQGGEVAQFIYFRNDGDVTVDIKCTLYHDNGKKDVGIGAIVKPGGHDYTNYVLANKVESLRCNVK
jgi:hypothetical protein